MYIIVIDVIILMLDDHRKLCLDWLLAGQQLERAFRAGTRASSKRPLKIV